MFFYHFVEYLFQLTYGLLMVRILLSWIPHDRYHPLVEFLYKITDPLLEPFRRLMPPSAMGIDFSPIIAFIVLRLLQNIVLSLIAGMLG